MHVVVFLVSGDVNFKDGVTYQQMQVSFSGFMSFEKQPDVHRLTSLIFSLEVKLLVVYTGN